MNMNIIVEPTNGTSIHQQMEIGKGTINMLKPIKLR